MTIEPKVVNVESSAENSPEAIIEPCRNNEPEQPEVVTDPVPQAEEPKKAIGWKYSRLTIFLEDIILI